MPELLHLLGRHELPNPITGHGHGKFGGEFTKVLVNGCVSVMLVLLGGLFAGLTLALMGQDETTLRVLSSSGQGKQRQDAQKVLHLLAKGKHWVLVTLLLGNVIVNEALPIVLDGEMNGSWIAVALSTCLVVIFGEIIPQSVCAKYGLAIGAKSATLVLCLMYILSPIGYPIARLLDHSLGTYHFHTFSREGLKALISLHEDPYHASEPLHPLEASVAGSLLSISTIPVSNIMTPYQTVFALSSETHLDDTTRDNIIRRGFSRIPVYKGCGDMMEFYAMLDARFLVGNTDSLKQSERVRDVATERLIHMAPSMSLAEAVGIFRYRGPKMTVISENGRKDGKVLGILTFRDVMEAALGGEMGMRRMSVDAGYGTCF